MSYIMCHTINHAVLILILTLMSIKMTSCRLLTRDDSTATDNASELKNLYDADYTLILSHTNYLEKQRFYFLICQNHISGTPVLGTCISALRYREEEVFFVPLKFIAMTPTEKQQSAITSLYTQYQNQRNNLSTLPKDNNIIDESLTFILNLTTETLSLADTIPRPRGLLGAIAIWGGGILILEAENFQRQDPYITNALSLYQSLPAPQLPEEILSETPYFPLLIENWDSLISLSPHNRKFVFSVEAILKQLALHTAFILNIPKEDFSSYFYCLPLKSEAPNCQSLTPEDVDAFSSYIENHESSNITP